MDELTAIPGVGRQRAGDLVVNRPYDAVPTVSADVALDRFVTVGSSVE
jgi:endonuclease III